MKFMLSDRNIGREYQVRGRLKDHMTQCAKDLLEQQWRLRDEWTPDGILVVHPEDRRQWLKNGPCPGCPCESWCDRICGLRARWWDDFRREVLRHG